MAYRLIPHRPMVPRALLLSLIVRSLSLLLPQTFFQPDEFYQALEPAHNLVFGYGHLTWEWQDLPVGKSGYEWWDRVVVGGRMRGWLWPAVFGSVYWLLQRTGLDETRLLAIAPRIIGVCVAALTDYATYRLAHKVLGPGSSAGAIFLSLTSLFNAHLLPRSLSTSPETLLTTLALTYFPLPPPASLKTILVGNEGMRASQSMRDVTTALASEKVKANDPEKEDVVVYEDVGGINYAVMDRLAPYVSDDEAPVDNLVLSLLLASLAICMRPTTLPFWGYLGAELVLTRVYERNFGSAVSAASTGILTFVSVMAATTFLDYTITGRLYVPILTFVQQNVFASLSTFYGATDPLYHLTQSLPILLFPIWWWWGQGFLACLLPAGLLPPRLAHLDQPAGLRTLARGITFAIAVLSFSPHSEWRFLHPILPSLLLFALPPLFRSFVPTIAGCYQLRQSVRQYTRLPKTPFYLVLLAPLLPYLYLNLFHGRAQVQVINALRRGDMGEVTGLVALTPCHSTPWQSHLHKDIPAWFLTCEPPIGVDPVNHHTQQSLFYASPVTYIQNVFPFPPVPLHRIPKTPASPDLPSHIIVFGSLLDQVEQIHMRGAVSVREALVDRGYRPEWKMWNGFDWSQDEAERRGGIQVWVHAEATT